jgi:hypothetical protein
MTVCRCVLSTMYNVQCTIHNVQYEDLHTALPVSDILLHSCHTNSDSLVATGLPSLGLEDWTFLAHVTDGFMIKSYVHCASFAWTDDSASVAKGKQPVTHASYGKICRARGKL